MRTTFTALVLAAATLMGCATTKPPLPDGDYAALAAKVVLVRKCAIDGNMPPSSAAIAEAQLGHYLHYHTFDMQRFIAAGNHEQRSSRRPTLEECRAEEMVALVKEARNRASAERVAQSNKEWADYLKANQPVHTICNKVGSQTLCTSN